MAGSVKVGLMTLILLYIPTTGSLLPISCMMALAVTALNAFVEGDDNIRLGHF